MKIIKTVNFSTHNYLWTSGRTLREAIYPWIKNKDTVYEMKREPDDIVNVLSGTGFSKEHKESLGIKNGMVLPLNIQKLYLLGDSGYDELPLSSDWILNFNTAKEFKFNPYCYSFKSAGRRFYVLNLEGNFIILSYYQKSWNAVPLKHPADRVSNYVPIA